MTIKILSEEVQRAYVRLLHRDDLKPTLDRREARLYVIQSINSILKIQYKEAFQEGHIQVPKSSIATYENVAVVTEGDYSTFTLPAFPIQLPMDMGVWEVHDANDPFNPYIPLTGHDAVLMGGNPASALEQLTGYYLDGKKGRFTKDLPNEVPAVTSVTVKLLVQNLDNITENDLLPISADQEIEVVRMSLESLGFSKVALGEFQKREEQEKQMTDE
jgi:hypothetical protein